MSTLEKFGILVILVLVVIIGVVAVWGVGGGEASPFDQAPPADGSVASADPALDGAAGGVPEWPNPAGPPIPADGLGAVAPPTLGAEPTPPSALSGAAPSAPASPGGTKYRIRKGDTLEGIAKATLGDGTRWKDIVAANPGLDPRRLKIDQEITIPDGASASVARAPAPPPAAKPPAVRSLVNPEDGATGPERASFREVEVRSGDTLYTIARRELGNGDLHYKIQKANPGLDPKRLRVGQKVRVPVDG